MYNVYRVYCFRAYTYNETTMDCVVDMKRLLLAMMEKYDSQGKVTKDYIIIGNPILCKTVKGLSSMSRRKHCVPFYRI